MCKHELSASTARRTERRCTSRRGATSCSSVDTRPRKCQLATPSARCQPTGPGTRPEQQAETASDVAIVVRAIQGLDEAAVNREVRAGDTAGAVAGQHEDEVGDLGRAGESAGDGSRGCLGGTLGRVRTGRLGDGLGDAVIAQPQSVPLGPG